MFDDEDGGDGGDDDVKSESTRADSHTGGPTGSEAGDEDQRRSAAQGRIQEITMQRDAVIRNVTKLTNSGKTFSYIHDI